MLTDDCLPRSHYRPQPFSPPPPSVLSPPVFSFVFRVSCFPPLSRAFVTMCSNEREELAHGMADFADFEAEQRLDRDEEERNIEYVKESVFH